LKESSEAITSLRNALASVTQSELKGHSMASEMAEALEAMKDKLSQHRAAAASESESQFAEIRKLRQDVLASEGKPNHMSELEWDHALLRQRMEETSQRNTHLQEQCNTLQQRLTADATAQADVKAKGEEIQSLRDAVAVKEKMLDDKNDTITTMKRTAAELQGASEKLHRRIRHLESELASECATRYDCETQIKDLLAKIDALESVKREAHQRIREYQEELQSLAADVAATRNQRRTERTQQMDKLEQKVAALREERAELRAQVRQSQSALQESQAKVERTEEEMRDLLREMKLMREHNDDKIRKLCSILHEYI